MKPETALHPAPAGILFRLMEQTAGFAGQDFFRELVRSLAAALDTEYAFVTQRLPEDLNRLKLMAGWHVNHAAGGVGEFDVPGTLARISKLLGDARIGISSVIQPEGHEGASVPLILMLHDAPNGAVSKALKRIAALPVVKGEPVMLRVESFD